MVNVINPIRMRIANRLKSLPIICYQKIRIWSYRLISGVRLCGNNARINQPVLMSGSGKITLGRCNLGVWPSPYFLSGYIHLEARGTEAEIVIGDGVWINNNAVIIAERSRIEIGNCTLIGPEFMVVDSDFHDLRPGRRLSGMHETLPTIIGKNVFIGARVTILKGVNVGDNSVIASGAVVTKSVMMNSIVGGVPAKIISEFRLDGKSDEGII
jgi:maltose O-acetyltransferase